MADANSRKRLVHTPFFHEKVLLYMHGFNVPPKDVFKGCKYYTDKYKREVIPLLWVNEKSPFTYRRDRVLHSPSAAEAFRDKLEVAKNIKKSLLCHSMGNYVLRLAARTFTGPKPFEHIFMVAADVDHDIFDASQNNHSNPTENDGLEIMGMAEKKVHVLHSWKDVAMMVRPRLKRGLGARGFRDTEKHPLHKSIKDGGRLVKHDCSGFSHEKDLLKNHGYQFNDDAIEYYEKFMDGLA